MMKIAFVTWMRADDPVARDHHGAEAPLFGGLR